MKQVSHDCKKTSSIRQFPRKSAISIYIHVFEVYKLVYNLIRALYLVHSAEDYLMSVMLQEVLCLTANELIAR